MLGLSQSQAYHRVVFHWLKFIDVACFARYRYSFYIDNTYIREGDLNENQAIHLQNGGIYHDSYIINNTAMHRYYSLHYEIRRKQL